MKCVFLICLIKTSCVSMTVVINFFVMSDPVQDPNQTQNPQASQPPATGGGASPVTQSGGQPATGQPPAGQPTGAQPPAGQAGQAQGNDLSGIMEENVDISGLIANAGNQQQQQDFIAGIKVPPHPNTKFDDKLFVQLLAGSISLTLNEKKRIVEAIPKLSQFQIDELIKIFQEEQEKFAELEKKHAEQVAELEKQHAASPEELNAQKEEETAKAQEDAKAEEIRKNLGL